jgi:hypothetical protein
MRFPGTHVPVVTLINEEGAEGVVLAIGWC